MDQISKTKISTANKFFSIFFAIYPILCIYKGFSKFTFGDLILIVFLLMSLTKPIDINNRLFSAFIFLSYSALTLFFNVFFSQSINGTDEFLSLLFRIVKLIFYMLCVFTTGLKYFNFKIFKHTIYISAVMATVFIVFQYFSYYILGKIILGQIPGLPIYLEDYAQLDYDKIYGYMFRPSSFFLEPSIFCQYTIAALIISLFTKSDDKKCRVMLNAAFTIGILLTTAGQGVLYLIVVYGLYLIMNLKNPIYTIVFSIFAFIFAKISYDKIEAVKMAVDRLSNQNAKDARFSSYSYCFSLNDIHALFGYGYGSTANGVYMPGAAYVWYGCGIIGLILAFLMFYSFFRSADNKCSKIICLIFFIMFFVTSLFYNYMLYWYFSLMILTGNKYIISSELQNKNENSLHSGSIQTESVR